MLGAAALHSGSEIASEQRPLVLDVGGRRVHLDPVEAARLRDAAAECAGRSSAARDLSVVLACGLSRHHVIALRRAEAHTLAQLASKLGLLDLAAEITARAA